MLTKVISQSTRTLFSKPSALHSASNNLRGFSSIYSKSSQVLGLLSSNRTLLNSLPTSNIKPLFRTNSTFAERYNTILYGNSANEKLKKLIAEADAEPQNIEKQVALMEALKPSEVISRYESGLYAQNEKIKALYVTALINNAGPQKVQIVSNESFTMSILKSTIPSLIAFGIIFSVFNYKLNSESDSEDPPIKKAHTLAVKPKVKFTDVKGIDEVKEDLEEVVQYLKNPDKFTKLGAKLPKGVLLCGDPGTGKTLLARAVAGEAEVPFLYASGSSFDEMFVGVGPKRIRDLFEDARQMAPCIVFIDEIDAVGSSRKYSFGSNAKESTLNQLLTELDGFQQTDGVIIIAATNLPDSLDPALVRPGRFDKQVHVHPPDLDGRKEILNLYLKKTKPAPDINVDRLARGTTGFTGADLFNLINQSAIKAAIAGSDHVDMKTIEESRDDIIMGGKKREIFLSEEEKLMTAYHESGHTLVAMYSHGAYPLHKATIAPRGGALGVTSFLPDDIYSRSRKQMKASLKVAMGGRAAEELVYGDDGVNTGASSDFKNATSMARRMVTELGFSDKVGKVYHGGKSQISERELQLIDNEIKELLDHSYSEAKTILKSREKELHELAKALLEHETLTVEEINLVVSGKKLPTPVAVPSKKSKESTKTSPKKEKATVSS